MKNFVNKFVNFFNFKGTKVKRTKGEQLVFTIAFVLIFIYSAFLLYHFYFLLQIATKGSHPEFIQDKINNNIASWSPNFTLKNFVGAFSLFKVANQPFLMLTFNSLWYSIGSVLINIFFEAAATYVICKYKFKGRRFLYYLVIARMMIPIMGSLPSTVRTYRAMGIMNSPLILITATDCLGGGFLIMYSFFKGISWEYAEAAFIDGAGHFSVFFRIYLPLAQTTFVSVYLLNFITYWND